MYFRSHPPHVRKLEVYFHTLRKHLAPKSWSGYYPEYNTENHIKCYKMICVMRYLTSNMTHTPMCDAIVSAHISATSLPNTPK